MDTPRGGPFANVWRSQDQRHQQQRLAKEASRDPRSVAAAKTQAKPTLRSPPSKSRTTAPLLPGGLVGPATGDSDLDDYSTTPSATPLPRSGHLAFPDKAGLAKSEKSSKPKRPPGPFRWVSKHGSGSKKKAAQPPEPNPTFSDRERRLRDIALSSSDYNTSSADETSSTWSDDDRPRVPGGGHRRLRNVTKSFLRRFKSSQAGAGDVQALGANYLTPTTPKASNYPFFDFGQPAQPPDAIPAEESLVRPQAGQRSGTAAEKTIRPSALAHTSSNGSPGSIPSPYTNLGSIKTGRGQGEGDFVGRSIDTSSSKSTKSLGRTKSHSDLQEEPEPPPGPNSPGPFPRAALNKTGARGEQQDVSKPPGPRASRSEPHLSQAAVPVLDTSSPSLYSSIKTPSSTSFDVARTPTTVSSPSADDESSMPSEKGRSVWKSRFSSPRKAENEAPANAGGLMDRFNLDWKPTPADAQGGARGPKAFESTAMNISSPLQSPEPKSASANLYSFQHAPLSPPDALRRPFHASNPNLVRSKLERVIGEEQPELLPFSLSDSHSTTNNSATAPELMSRESTAIGTEVVDEEACPVCLEKLSFRLTGEKPHIVPTCGHALHHACFTAVYGSPEAVLSAQSAPGRSQAPGMCGVCRRLIVLGDGSSSRRPNKLAGMMGMDSEKVPDTTSESGPFQSGDDPLDALSAMRNGRARERNGSLAATSLLNGGDDSASVFTARGMALPVVRARPEYSTIYRKRRDEEEHSRQNVVCVVTIEVPARRRLPELEEDETLWQQKLDSIRPNLVSEDERDDVDEDGHDNGREDSTVSNEHPTDTDAPAAVNEQVRGGSSVSEHDHDDEGFSYGATPAQQDNNSSFASAIEDLRARILDWKGHSVDRFGKLELHDFLGVRQDSVVREFFVYLFQEALLCVTEEKKRERGLSRLIGSGASNGDDPTTPSSANSSRGSKAALKLKGRIWLRHIRRCEMVQQEGSPCLSIKLDDEGLDHFILCFQDTGLREQWRQKLSMLLQRKSPSKKEDVSAPGPIPTTPVGEKGKHGSKAPPSPAADHSNDVRKPSINASNGKSSAGTQSGQAAGRNVHTMAAVKAKEAQHKFLAGLPQHQQWSASGGLDPLAPVPDLMHHTPVDIIIMVSVPSVASQPAVSSSTLSSSAALKLRLIRSTLSFVISHMGPRDRIALVSYNVGLEGLVRRTALLNTTKEKSREKLEQFVETIGKPWDGPGEDPFLEDIDRLAGNGDRTDTVTAVNVGFDIVLQRKSKNPITGMILINDTADAPKRGQMDLVMARAEAANVPVHCFGFGKSHDPSSLWLISNHTRGSYTFVKEWYQLRECVAGCIGAILSVALTDVKMHISVPSDNHFRVRKVAGPSGAIVSASGKDVDIEMGEMRFGERKELFVELELDFAALLTQRSMNGRRKLMNDHYEKGSATDDFMQRLGLQGLSIADGGNRNGGSRDNVPSLNPIEEVAVLEVQCGCRDPGMGVTTSRLPDPCVLTVEVDSVSQDPAADASTGATSLATALADPVVTRRRLEILVSDMITRSLLLVSRRNHHQALTILIETRKIVDTVLQAIPLRNLGEAANGTPGSTKRNNGAQQQQQPGTQDSLMSSQFRGGSYVKRQRELMHRKTALSLLAILDDLDVLIDGLESGKSSSFERTERNFGAQQAMVLRDQKAWTSRTDTEWQFFRSIDNGPPFAAMAASFAAYAAR